MKTRNSGETSLDSFLTLIQSIEPPWFVIRMRGGVGWGSRENSPYPDLKLLKELMKNFKTKNVIKFFFLCPIIFREYCMLCPGSGT